ncbi:MAG: SAM-dependent chlorinase/fluorinase [Verrucomicrobiota bacterium]
MAPRGTPSTDQRSRPLPTLAGLAALALLAGCGATAETPAPRPTMPTVALLSDFGNKDSYVAEMKGALLSVQPEVNLVDLSHEIEPFNVSQGAYLIDQMASAFPRGTVLVGVVDPGTGSKHDPILIETDAGKYYLGPNNGIFSIVIAREGLANAWKLNNADFFPPEAMGSTFHGRDVFAPAAGHLVSGVAPDELGEAITTRELELPGVLQPAKAGSHIIADVIHIDRFGNVLTSLPKGFTPLLQEGKLANITVNKQKHTTPVAVSFADMEKDRLFLIFGSSGVLEIARKEGSAAEMLQAKVGDKVTIQP